MMDSGKFVFISGPMFCGKTEELLRILTRYQIAGRPVLVYKPKKDTRYGREVICTHDKRTRVAKEINSFDSIVVDLSNLKLVDKAMPSAIFIDEVQFIEKGSPHAFVKVVTELGISLYVSGLILDSFRNPFKVSSELLPHAHEIRLLTAVCTECGGFNGVYTYRKADSSDQIYVGGSDEYTVLCSKCYNIKMKSR